MHFLGKEHATGYYGANIFFFLTDMIFAGTNEQIKNYFDAVCCATPNNATKNNGVYDLYLYDLYEIMVSMISI